ncbi:11663_t:CDS:2 [Entrophospora sp. SA101]|nr:11663_t:CDS:2 [Entrophospora sp. SA101]
MDIFLFFIINVNIVFADKSSQTFKNPPKLHIVVYFIIGFGILVILGYCYCCGIKLYKAKKRTRLLRNRQAARININYQNGSIDETDKGQTVIIETIQADDETGKNQVHDNIVSDEKADNETNKNQVYDDIICNENADNETDKNQTVIIKTIQAVNENDNKSSSRRYSL